MTLNSALYGYRIILIFCTGISEMHPIWRNIYQHFIAALTVEVV